MAVNDKIRKVDYNTIQTKLANVIGTGSATSGWGQSVISSQVDESNTIGVNEWGKLRYDIINAYKHIYGSNPSTSEAIINQLVRNDADTTSFTGSISGNILRVSSVASGMLAVGQTISGTGVVGSPVITGSTTQESITISALSSKTGSTPGPYSVTYTIPTQPVAPQTGVEYIVAGNSNAKYNGTFKATASTTTSITLEYTVDPDSTNTATYISFGSAGTTVVVDDIQNIVNGQTVTGTGFSSGQTVVSTQNQRFESNNCNIVGGTLYVGTVVSGTIYPGMVISGDNLPIGTRIVSNVSGSGSGSEWLISSGSVTTSNIMVNGSRNIVTVSSGPTSTPSGTLTFKFSYGSGTTTVTKSRQEDPWGRSSWTLSTSQTLSSRSLTAVSSTAYPVTQYDTLADTITNNRFTVHSTQSSTTAWPAVTRTWDTTTSPQIWTVKIQSTVTATWTSGEAARKFFNSGGTIRFASSRSGSSTPAQNKSWTDLLATTSSSPLTFGGNVPSSGTAAMDGKNYFRCTSAYQVALSITASTPYGGNLFQVQARTPFVANNSTGTAAVVEFLVEWIDGYVDPGNYYLDNPNTTEQVNGTFSLNVSHLYAVGTMDPTGTPAFAVESPSISVSSITGS